MNEYWKHVLHSIPDDHFIPQAETYTVLNIWHDSQNDTSQLEKSSIQKDILHQWARSETTISNKTGSTLVFQCLVVSTHQYNDWPVDISRDDLAYVAQCLGLADAHLHLLFAPYTGCATLDREVCWYYGQPGNRALVRTNTIKNLTRCVLAITEPMQSQFEDCLDCFSSFARHPLILAFTLRAIVLKETERLMLLYIGGLRKNEALTGFHVNHDEESGLDDPKESSSPAQSLDLGLLTKRIGSSAANLGNFKRYQQQSEDMVEMDTVFESMRQGLLEAAIEYQNRAKNLQSVIFNLIAKEDANASINLAIESRAIAVATRNDGTSMKTIAVMTMVFLPATFYAALFTIPSLQWQQSPVIQTNFWIYWAFTVPSTVIVLLTWYSVVSRQVQKEARSSHHGHNSPIPSRSTKGFTLRSLFATDRTASRPTENVDIDDFARRRRTSEKSLSNADEIKQSV